MRIGRGRPARPITILSGLKGTGISVAVQLTGQAAQADVGSAFSGLTLQGQSLTSAAGMLSNGSKRGYLAWARLTIPLPGLLTFSATLTGLEGVSAGGTFPLANPKRAYLSWARLTTPISTSVDLTLTGDAAPASVGTLTPIANSTVQQLTGQQCDSASGDLAQGRASLLVGLEMVSAGGSVGTSDDVFVLYGQMIPVAAVTAVSTALAAQIGVLIVTVDDAIQVTLVGQEGVTQSTPAVASTEVLVLLSGLESAALVGAIVGGLEATELIGLEAIATAANTFLQGEVQLSGLGMTATAGMLLAENTEWEKVPTQSSIWTPRPGSPATWT